MGHRYEIMVKSRCYRKVTVDADNELEASSKAVMKASELYRKEGIDSVSTGHELVSVDDLPFDAETTKSIHGMVLVRLSGIMERDDAERFADKYIAEICTDIAETADRDFSYSDVGIAISRVLKGHLGLD